MHRPNTEWSQISSLFEAVCASDPSAWCFIPLDRDEAASCSERFCREWCSSSVAPGVARTQLTVKSIADALEAAGIPAATIFDSVAATVTEFPDRMTVTRADGVRAKIAIQCIFDRVDGEILGHLVRFVMLTDHHLIDSVLDQIAIARKKLRVLSKRELEILNLVYEGRTNKAISISMKISEKTVEKHRARIMMKLGLSSTAVLVRTIAVAMMLPMPVRDFEEETLDGRLASVVQKSLR